MDIKLHKQAATTPRIRAEIQSAPSSITDSELARQYGVATATIRRWRHRDNVHDRSHTRHNLLATLTSEQEEVLIAAREFLRLGLDDLLVVAREFLNPRLSRSGLHRMLKRRGVPTLAALAQRDAGGDEKPRHKPFKDYEPGYVHIDIKHLPQMPDEKQKRYLYVAIDRATRWVYLEIRSSQSAQDARAFMKQVEEKAPFTIQTVLTDNGKSFTDRFTRAGERQPSGRHPFDQECQAHGIEHRLIKPGRPQTNGMVERFNGRISDVLATRWYTSGKDLEQTLKRYAWLYNHHISQKALHHQSPITAMKEWQAKRPELFTKRVVNHTGPDTIKEFCDSLKEEGCEPEYVTLIRLYLHCALGRLADLSTSWTSWIGKLEAVRNTYARQALPMVWDFTEVNPLTDKWEGSVNWVSKVVRDSLPSSGVGRALQEDAANIKNVPGSVVISTDPPYYDNIPYSNLSDFFYFWLRKGLRSDYPDLFSTMATPKAPEIVANKERHGGRESAEIFFEQGMAKALKSMRDRMHPAFPVSIYYAFKQTDETKEGTGSTGWKTFLNAVIESGFSITGTWPVRTERSARTMSIGMNALASSVVLVCNKRPETSETISRRDFQRQLRDEMPDALETMIGGESGQAPIAPVDLAQAAIGPGMAIYSKYEAVLNQDGSQMSVHDALVLINRAITDFLTPDSGNFDADTQFCASWFDQYAWSTGPFGEAQVLAQAKGTNVDGVKEAGVVESGGGKVRLLKWEEYQSDWDPVTDKRTPIWEACHQMIRRLQNHGESAAGELLAKMPEKGEAIRQLSYHLYTLCERKRWAEEARAYNELIGSWHAIVAASHETGHVGEQVGLEL